VGPDMGDFGREFASVRVGVALELMGPKVQFLQELHVWRAWSVLCVV
jgi:hypothetical protein